MGKNSTASSDDRDSFENSILERKKAIIKHIIFYILWAIVFAVEFLYRQPLFDKSIELQIELQASITDFGIVVFRGLSIWGDGVPYFLAFGFMLNFESRGRAFYYLCFLTACGYLMNITKMGYHEPRPFMVTDQIKVYGCSMEYGNPSGHSLFAAAFNFFFFLDLCHAPGNKVSQAKYYSLLSTAIVLTFMIGFARFYVGVHTLNQIVYGWQLGVLLAFYVHYCWREHIINHITYLIEKAPARLPYTKYIIVSSVIGALAFSTQIITYVIVQMTIDQGNEEAIYLANILKQSGCSYDGGNWIFNRKSVVISGLGTMAYGGYLGVLFQVRFFRTLYWPLMLKTPLTKFLLRILVIVALVAPFGVVFLVIPTDTDLTVMIIFKTLLPLLCMLFCLFAFCNYFFVRFKLVNESQAGVLPVDQRLKLLSYEQKPDKHH